MGKTGSEYSRYITGDRRMTAQENIGPQRDFRADAVIVQIGHRQLLELNGEKIPITGMSVISSVDDFTRISVEIIPTTIDLRTEEPQEKP